MDSTKDSNLGNVFERDSKTCGLEETQKNESQLKTYKKHQNDLRKRLWAHVRKDRIKGDSINSLPVWQAWELQTKFKDWYLSEMLYCDCRGRDGCCARICGCCEEPRVVDGVRDSIFTQGQCTSACACCMEARGIEGDGFEAEIPDLQELEPELKLSLTGEMSNYIRILIKGLVFSLKYSPCSSLCASNLFLVPTGSFSG